MNLTVFVPNFTSSSGSVVKALHCHPAKLGLTSLIYCYWWLQEGHQAKIASMLQKSPVLRVIMSSHRGVVEHDV